jgi:signal transduction histidine kinase
VVGHLEMQIKKNMDLAIAHDSEKKSNISKSTFMANMSHELRTPLNAIIGYSELLEEDAEVKMDNESLQDIEKIKSAAKHLLSLINEILDLSKIEAGHMEIFTEDIELHVFIDEIIAFVGPLLHKNNNRIKLHFSKDITIIHTDIIKLRQIFFNLISNSTKFTKNGEITLTVKRHDDNLLIHITDTGIGIAKEQIEKLFIPFEQADQSTTRRYGGTGLGLAITKQYCEMLGGAISIDSNLGQGTTFTIELPLTLRQDDDVAMQIMLTG